VATLIDEIYKKERKYIGNYDSDNILCSRSPIFHLETIHHLKQTPKDTIQPAQLTTLPSQLHIVK
jgi:hypothetical protein